MPTNLIHCDACAFERSLEERSSCPSRSTYSSAATSTPGRFSTYVYNYMHICIFNMYIYAYFYIKEKQ